MMTNILGKKSQLPKLQHCPKNQLPMLPNIIELAILLDLLKYREVTLFRELMTTIEKKTKQDKKPQFEVLMFEVSDIIQNLAQAYGERQVLEFCIELLKSVKCSTN